MTLREARRTIETAARDLRKIALERPPGALIGREEELIAQLGCSRSTVRQVARLLEREGLLKVRRGINGGYFGARPDAGTIEATVSTYLETMDVDERDTTIVASALWVEAMRKAAAADREEARAFAAKAMARLRAVKDSATFERVRDLELSMQSEVFTLARAAYVKLIFDINISFAQRKFAQPVPDDSSETHRDFVRAWRDAKLLELSAIERGDTELAAMAGQHSRKIWHQRILERFA